ncbi:hypothetical protein QBC38DRAFT_101070 [Podospora fimiseda]|uniref:Uncharacterized protein n=1 Tax=Podospora fimiseda TaxID=252190 RepID=A0AAN6YNP6_9PEZI|nr:hypothetical protein QBC38DRAFT_101070 [Podospora fimiseda]
MDDSDFSFEVGFVPTERQDNNFRLSNLPGHDFRRTFAETTNERSPLYMRIRLAELHHGSMVHDGKKHFATLLLFEFRFESRLQDNRYESARITFDFLDKEGESKRDPVVVALAPDRMHWLNKTSYDRTTRYGVQAGGELGGAELGVHWEVEQTKQKRFKATVTGSPTHIRGKLGDDSNAVMWTMQENKDGSREGIPSFLQAAVLLARRFNTPFIAKLNVKTDVNFASLGHRALPFTTDKDSVIDLVTLRPEETQMVNSSSLGITDQDLEHMERLQVERYFSVNLSEEDPLITPDPRTPAPSSVPATQPTLVAASEPDTPDSAAPVPSPLVPPRAPATNPETGASTPSPAAPLLGRQPLANAAPSAVAVVVAAAKAAAAASQAVELAARAAEAAAQAAAAVAEASSRITEASVLAAETAERLAIGG